MISLLQETWDEFNRDEVPMLGAAMAYWAALSLMPLLLLLLALFGKFLSVWPVAMDARTALLEVVARYVGPQFSNTIAGLLEDVSRRSTAATGIGLLFLLFGAAGVFRQLRYSFRKIWGLRRPETARLRDILSLNVLEQLGAMLLALATAALFLVSFVITAASQAVRGFLAPLLGSGVAWEPAIEPLVVLSLSFAVFLLLYRFLPPVRVRWRDVWLGALLAALLWEVAKRLLTLYLMLFPTLGLYGAAGLLFVVMIWVYFSCQILFMGAEFCKVWARAARPAAAAPSGGQEVINSTEAIAEKP